MKVVRFAAGNAPVLVSLSALAGMIAGLGSIVLIALINRTLSLQQPAPAPLILAYVALCVLVPLTRLGSATLLIRLSQRMIFDVRMGLSRRILAVPLQHLEETGAHRLLAALTDDVANISNAVVNIPVVCVSLAVLIGCIAYVGYLSLHVLAVMLAAIAIGVIAYLIPMARANRRLRLARDVQNDLFQNFNGLTLGIKELKLHKPRADSFTDDVLEVSAADVRRHMTAGMTTYAAASSVGQALLFGALGLLIFNIDGGAQFRTEVLIGSVLVALYMMGPLEVVVNALPIFGRANIALTNVERLGLLLAGPPADARPLPSPQWRKLELDRIQFRYRGEDGERGFNVGPISLELEPAQIVFVTGGNGAGKTTFAKLLTGLYKPSDGQVRLDGRVIDDSNRLAYMQNFAAVFFDFYLFDRLLGIEPERMNDQAAFYLNELHLSHKVKIEDGHLSTTDLSQGQRKRLALLTAYLEDRSIYVFDEWAADQDPLFKDVFYRKLLPELRSRGKTIVVISHDDRYFDVADRLVNLQTAQLGPPIPHEVSANVPWWPATMGKAAPGAEVFDEGSNA
jgi:putative ATP-binding cassette transporter